MLTSYLSGSIESQHFLQNGWNQKSHKWVKAPKVRSSEALNTKAEREHVYDRSSLGSSYCHPRSSFSLRLSSTTWPRLPRSLLPRPRRRPHLPSPRRQQRHLMGRMVGLSRLHSCNSDVPHARTYVYILYMLRYTKTKSTGDDKAS